MTPFLPTPFEITSIMLLGVLFIGATLFLAHHFKWIYKFIGITFVIFVVLRVLLFIGEMRARSQVDCTQPFRYPYYCGKLIEEYEYIHEGGESIEEIVKEVIEKTPGGIKNIELIQMEKL